MSFYTKIDFSRQVIQYNGTYTELSGSTNVLGSFLIKDIELDTDNITYGETLIYDGVKLKAGLSGSFQDRVIVGMGISVDPINALNYNIGLGQYAIGSNQYFYSGGSITINDGDPTLNRFDVIYITSANTPSVLMGTSSPSPVTPTLSSGQLNLGIILVPAGYYSGTTGTTIFTPTGNDSPFRYYTGYTSAIDRSDGNSSALNNFAIALSRDSRATGQDSVAIGYGTKTDTNFQTAIGKNNDYDSDAVLIVGYSDDNLSPKNALTIDISGNTNVKKALVVKDIEIDTQTPNNGDVLAYDGVKYSPASNRFSSDFVVSLTSPKTLGKYTNGQTVPASGKTAMEVLLDIAIEYLNPAFNSFSISGQSTLVEIGSSITGSKTFIWGTTNSSNVSANTINIVNTTSSSILISGTTNDGSQIINISTITFNSSPQIFNINAINTLGAILSSNFTINTTYPYFYGKYASGGASAGVNRPVANQSLINSGTKVVASSTGTITITFNSTSDDYIWFAIPTVSTSKTKWYINALNNGNIGGSISVGGNLFPAYDSVSINDVTFLYWSGIIYKIYISNYQTGLTVPIQLQN